jgi:hypothetical protein
MFRAIILYNQYSQSDADIKYHNFKNLFKYVTNVDFDYLVIDNYNEGDWVIKRKVKETIIGGDNSYREFSGWTKGYKYILEQEQSYDFIVLSNDKYDINVDQYSVAINDPVFSLIKSENLVAGNFYFRNALPRPLSYILFRPERYVINGNGSRYWVRSNFIISSYKLWTKVDMCILRKEMFFTAQYNDLPFRQPSGISQLLQDRIINYLCPQGKYNAELTWHSRFVLGPKTFDLFVDKATAILNELWLTMKLQKCKIQIVDFRLLAKLDNHKQISSWFIKYILRFVKSKVNIQLWIVWWIDKVVRFKYKIRRNIIH